MNLTSDDSLQLNPPTAPPPSAVSAEGGRTAFRTWRCQLGLTQAGAATVLDYGKRRVEAWDRGEEEPSLTIRLAMAALEQGIRPIGE